MKFTTILVDADIYLHRACHTSATKVTFGDETTWTMNVKLAGGYLRREFKALRDRFETKNMRLALGDRNANFRKDLCATYKAHRTAYLRPPGFHELEANLKAHAKTVSAPRLEGDDILGILATTPSGAPREGVVIVSIDKDLLQVPGWHYNPDKDELQEVDEAAGAYFHLMQTLTGDRVDGYPGLPGCGPVKAAKILSTPIGGDGACYWERIVVAYVKAGLTAADALLQARLARVLRAGDYDRKTKEIKLWTP